MRRVAWAQPVSHSGGRACVPAQPRLTALRGLVGPIRAVPVMVTHEVLGDALAVLAHELAVVASAVVHCGQRWTWPLSPPGTSR